MAAAAGTLTNSSVRRNEAGAEGGGIYTESGSLTVTRSTVSDNDSTNNGGGIFFTSPGTLNVTNSTLSGNESHGLGRRARRPTRERPTSKARPSTETSPTPTPRLRRRRRRARPLRHGDREPQEHDPGRQPRPKRLPSIPTGTATAASSRRATTCSPAPPAARSPRRPATRPPPTRGWRLWQTTAARRSPTRCLPTQPGDQHRQPRRAGLGAGACPSTDQRGVPRSLGGRCDKGAYERVSCQGKLVNRVGTERPRPPGRHLGRRRHPRPWAATTSFWAAPAATASAAADGNDQLFGEAGPDFLDGGADTDTCDGGTESDQAVGCETISSIP